MTTADRQGGPGAPAVAPSMARSIGSPKTLLATIEAMSPSTNAPAPHA